MKKIFLIIWVLGFVLLCTFRTPVQYFQYYDRYVVIHSHIFNNQGRILLGQFMLYNVFWLVFILLTYYLFVFIKKNK